MPCFCALDLVTSVSSLRGRLRASSKAKRMMRVTPARVKMAVSVPTSSGCPRCARPPHVGVLIEAWADGHPQAPECDVVRQVGCADRAEVDRIEALERVQPIG